MENVLALFLTPLASSVVIALLQGFSPANLKRMAVLLSLIPLALLLNGHSHWVGSSFAVPWLSSLNVYFHLGIDSLSLVFLYLTATLIPIILLSVSTRRLDSPYLFFALVLLLQALLIGFFTAQDLFVFTVFWESMLLPLYFIINIWGGPQRQQASLKFIIYMIAGSALMIAAVLGLYLASASAGTGTFNIEALRKVHIPASYEAWICGIFLLAFAVKTPLFPFHAWLPDAYTTANTQGTMLLSALLSKAGIYGILRISLAIFPTVMQHWSPILLALAIAGVLYGGLAAWQQNDFKRMLAYSSFSHVNFVLAGLFVWNETAHAGAILQAVNHGITILALFLVAGWLESRLGSTSMLQAGGLAAFFPQLCWITLFFVLASVAVPGTNNFIGELMIFFGVFAHHPWLTAVLGLTIILSVMYMLRWMQMIYFETPNLNHVLWGDIRAKELIIALPLIALVLWIGIYPTPVLREIKPAAEKINIIAKVDNR